MAMYESVKKYGKGKSSVRKIKDKMFQIPMEEPLPDFESLKRVLRGEKKPERVHFVELLMDEKVKKDIVERFFGKRWIPYSSENKEKYLLQDIDFWSRMGYDYIRVSGGGEVTLNWPGAIRKTEDIFSLSRGERIWAEEGKGIISSWEDFEKYPWPNPQKIDYSPSLLSNKNLAG